MIIKIGRIIATTVAIVTGLFVLVDMFANQWPGAIFGIAGLKETISGVGFLLVSWAAIVTAFALFLGFANLVSVHVSRIRTKKTGAMYSGVLLLSLIITLIVGAGGPTSTNGQFIFEHILHPLEATFSALLALFIATAAFRAFRIRDFESALFVLVATIVLLGQLPLGLYFQIGLPAISELILNIPTLGGIRGILLGVALGTIATGLRVLIGTDRPYSD